jgi:hypothetical protein
MNLHNRRWLRISLLALMTVVLLVLSACATPTTFPNGNNATCWKKLDSVSKETPVCEETTEKWTDFGDVWTWSQCNSAGTTIFEMAYDETQCQTYDTTLLNKGHADTIAQVYFGQDEAGYPALGIYCVWPDQEPQLALTIRWDFGSDVEGMSPSGGINGTEQCAAPVEMELMFNGEYEIRIGPDTEGKVATMAFTTLPPTDLHFYDTVVSPTPSD